MIASNSSANHEARRIRKPSKFSDSFEPDSLVSAERKPLLCPNEGLDNKKVAQAVLPHGDVKLFNTPIKKTLRSESETFEADILTDKLSSGLSTKIGSPREELTSMQGFAIKVDGELILGMQEFFIDEHPRQKYFFLARHAASPLGADLQAPDEDATTRPDK